MAVYFAMSLPISGLVKDCIYEYENRGVEVNQAGRCWGCSKSLSRPCINACPSRKVVVQRFTVRMWLKCGFEKPMSISYPANLPRPIAVMTYRAPEEVVRRRYLPILGS